MKSHTILVVDDEPFICRSLSFVLRKGNYKVLEARNGEEALAAIREHRPDLVFLDVMMPKINGFEVTEFVRSDPELVHTKIILLTAKGQDSDREIGRKAGADDYMTKPFSPRELVARVKAVLRRSEFPRGFEGDTLRFGGLSINPRTRQVQTRGQEADLTAREFDLLWFLAQHPRQVFSREQLLNEVWDYLYAGDTSTVTVHIRRLREKIEADPTRPSYILTVWGVGYKFGG